jgi:excisionase family DNA binding protein
MCGDPNLRQSLGRYSYSRGDASVARPLVAPLVEPGKLWHLLSIVVLEGQGMPDEILTLSEVATLLKVADKTVYTMAQRAEIPAFKVRGQWRFKRQDIDLWIEQQKSTKRDDAGR